jgi:site-specific DNA-methyltransferase (adenine-specific)
MLTPYYEDEYATIYHGDCREVLPRLESVDLVLTDPPYGLDWKEMKFDQKSKVDWQSAKAWDARPENALIELVKQKSREWIIWGGNYMAGSLGDCKAPLVWDKQTGANNFADGEMAFTSFQAGTLRIFRHQWCGAFKDSERGVRNYHPTQKPVLLYQWILENYAKPGQLILDTHVGSASSLIACESMGFDYVGFEIDPDYYAAAKNRMSKGIQSVLI